MMSWRARFASLALAALLAACGGGGGGNAGVDFLPGAGGTASSPTGTVTATASDLTVTVSSPTMPSVTSASVDVTVTAVDANRATLPNVPVQVSVNSGATIQTTGTLTNTGGQITGKLSPGSDATPRRITITASSGGVTRTAFVDIVSVTASDMTLTITPATLSNSGTATVTAVATAVDANRATVSGIPITLSVNSGATVRTSSTLTDGNGQVSGVVSLGEDKSNRTILVTAVSGGITRTASIQVTGSKINATVLGAVLSPGQSGSVQYRLVDANNNPMVGQRFVVIGPAGVQTVATTGSNGEYNFNYVAPAVPGQLEIRASAAGVDNLVSVLINSGPGVVPAVTTTVRSASLSANPSVVPINTPTTSNRSEVRALFLSDGNTPVKNVRVRFDLNGDAQAIGGTLTSGATLVYSDVNGVAVSAYVPAGRFSPTDGVTVRACWDYTDFSIGTCPNAALATLTVTNDALSVSIGTNNLIGEGDSKLTYVTRYVVQVVDSSGLAAADVQVSAAVDLLNFYKGVWKKGIDAWVQEVRATCDNEDLNRNGVSEVYSNGQAEDANGSSNRTPGRPALEPRKADVAISFEGSSKTNASGQVVMRIEYPQNVGSWVKANIVVSASGVAGTEGRANFDDVLNVPAAVVNKLDADPPFRLSPYGILISPTISVSLPGTNKTAQLCTNPD